MTSGPVTVSWLNLHTHGIPRDVRKLIYKELSDCDFMLVRMAHNSRFIPHKCTVDMSFYCAIHGYDTLLLWWKSIGGEFIYPAFDCAAEHGHLSIMTILFHDKPLWFDIELLDGFPHAFAIAAGGGHLHILEWLYYITRGIRKVTGDVVENAAENGHLHVLEWGYNYQDRFPFTLMSYIAAVAGGHLNVLTWLRLHCESPVPADITVFAAQHGRTEMLRLFAEHGHYVKNGVACAAAKNGHLETLQYVIQCGHFPFTEHELMVEAIRNGHLVVVQFLYKRTEPTKRLQSYASIHGMLHIMKWFHEEHCPIDVDECWYIADGGGCYNIMEWLNKTFHLNRRIVD